MFLILQTHMNVFFPGASEPANMRFTIQPAPGESGFSQWVAAMKMVAQLPGGIPAEFRRRLWLTMAERHLDSQDVSAMFDR